ncbi:MAG: ABC transporter substrate-binding protein [Dehalococcoidia bacterium]|nr:ABC transporter substrate-binding protein [Dehalococcoidia bacterium]
MRFRWGGLILAVLIVGLLVLAGCSTTSAPGAAVSKAEDTRPTGSLTMAVNFMTGVLVDTGGKALEASGTFQSLGGAIWDSLIELNADGQVQSGIAERWDISKDGLSHTFYIRKGVKFQNGDDLTGADVKFSLDGALKDAVSTNSTIWKAAVDSIELKDDYTVVMHMKTPQYDLIKGIGSWEGQGAVVPKKYIEEKGWDYFAKNPIGSGPWKVVSFQANARLELEAVESHWRAVPKFKNISLVKVNEEATRVAMLKTGELDTASDISPDSIAALKAAGLRIYGHYGSAQWYGVPFWDMENPTKYAFNDVRVRKAMSLAIDRKEVADKIYGGYAQPSALFYAPKTAYFFDANVIKPDPYDPEQAKKLLAEAGFASGFTTKIWDTGGGSVISTANQALSGYWRKLGINAEVSAIDYATLLKKWIPKQIPDMWPTVFAYQSPGGVLNFERMVTAYHSTKGSMKNINNPKLDELIDKVPATLDPTEKKKLALEAAVLAKSETTVIAGVDVDTLFALGSKVGTISPVKGTTGLARAYETITHAK